MNIKNINRNLRALTVGLCLGAFFTHTTSYAADEMSAPMLDQGKAVGGQGGSGEDKSLLLQPKACKCKVVVESTNPPITPSLVGFFLSQDMDAGSSASTDNQCRSACAAVVANPSSSAVGTAVNNYMQGKCTITFKVYGKKAGNNYGNQSPTSVTRTGTGQAHPAVAAYCS